jgi:PAS domain S-box-containing protein
VLDGETVERVALTAQRGDGMFVPVSVTFASLERGGGACVIVRDLSERFISQQTMADGQALMAEAQMLSHFGIWLWHAPSGTVQMSEELFRIHGLHPADFDGRMASRGAMAHRDDRKPLVRRLRSALAGLAPFEMEYRLVRPNGDIRWVYERANVVTDQTGEIAGLRGIRQDVTERREAADHLRRRTVLLDMLRHITVAANESSDLREALESCVQQICSTFGWPVGHAVLLGPGNVVEDHLWFLARPERFGRYQRAVDARSQPDAAGIAGMVLQSCEPVWVEDTSAALAGGTLRAASEAGLRSGFGFPVAGDAGFAAVVELFSPERRKVDPDFVEATVQGATQLGRVVERIRARDYRSMHDPLTHLPNRAPFAGPPSPGAPMPTARFRARCCDVHRPR